MLQNPDLEEELRRYWVGKRPKVKAATMEWISSKGTKTQAEVAAAYGVTYHSIYKHAKKLRKLGVAIWCSTALCISCNKDVSKVFPRFTVYVEGAEDHPKVKETHIRGYLCTDCAKKFPGLQTKNRKEFLMEKKKHLHRGHK